MNKQEDQNQMKNIIMEIKTIISVLNSRPNIAGKKLKLNEQETELMKLAKMQHR